MLKRHRDGARTTHGRDVEKYFDIDSFLAEQARVPVVFNSGCTGLGKEMDKMCQTRGTFRWARRWSSPFWLVPKLFEQNMVGPKMPDCFDERVWQVVEAEPKNVPLEGLQPALLRVWRQGSPSSCATRSSTSSSEKAFTARGTAKLLVGAALSTSEVQGQAPPVQGGGEAAGRGAGWHEGVPRLGSTPPPEKLTVAHTRSRRTRRDARVGAYGSNQRRAMGDNLTNRGSIPSEE